MLGVCIVLCGWAATPGHAADDGAGPGGDGAGHRVAGRSAAGRRPGGRGQGLLRSPRRQRPLPVGLLQPAHEGGDRHGAGPRPRAPGEATKSRPLIYVMGGGGGIL